MYESENSVMTPEEELVDILLDFIIVAANLAKGFSLEDSVRRAKAYITDALKAGLDLGQGSGPMDHTLGKNSNKFFI